MPDPIFADPRLTPLYDALDGGRSDLDLYVDLVGELGARRVLDVGCGTGTLACRLALTGTDVTGIDPAGASLDVARAKEGADRVRWILGTAADAPPLGVDLAVMTGNVAQVFTTDDEWSLTLHALASAIRPGGYLAFETRDPSRRAWERWTPERTQRTIEVPGTGSVTAWTELLTVDPPLVSFRHHIRFGDDGAVLTSDSTLRFRRQQEIVDDLEGVGFAVEDVRDAPERPGLEWVFVARLAEAD